MFDECHAAVQTCNYAGFIICFISGFIATTASGGAFQVNSKALTINNVVLQFRCRQVDDRNFINFCYFSEFISIEKFGVVKDPDFTVLDLIYQHGLISRIFPQNKFYSNSFICYYRICLVPGLVTMEYRL